MIRPGAVNRPKRLWRIGDGVEHGVDEQAELRLILAAHRTVSGETPHRVETFDRLRRVRCDQSPAFCLYGKIRERARSRRLAHDLDEAGHKPLHVAIEPTGDLPLLANSRTNSFASSIVEVEPNSWMSDVASSISRSPSGDIDRLLAASSRR